MEPVAFPQVTAQAIFAAGVTGAAGENLRRCAPDRANGPGPTLSLHGCKRLLCRGYCLLNIFRRVGRA
jgi:hypothetical protein